VRHFLLGKCADIGISAAERLGLLFGKTYGRHDVRVLMYHEILPQSPSRIGRGGVDREMFRKQMHYLKEKFRLLHANELNDPPSMTGPGSRPRLMLTFDDGIGNNASVAWPILEQLKIPAIFFVSLRHTEPDRFLWFMHAIALFMLHPGPRIELMNREWPLASPVERRNSWKRFVAFSYSVNHADIYAALSRYPVASFVPPEIIENEMRGMTPQEIAAIAASELVTIGAHTLNHPYLTKCSESDLRDEIFGSKTQLEQICRREVTMFAYPDGDYDQRVVAAVKRSGFQTAFAVNLREGLSSDNFTARRSGVYRGGTGLLAAKAYGWLK